jgi:DNA-binding cell septation regulator SpoVG
MKKEAGRILKYSPCTIDTTHVITKDILVIKGTKRTISKPSRKHLRNGRGKHESAEILFSNLQGA